MKPLNWIYDRLTRVIPPAAAARIDLLRPGFRNPWGGPLNGQHHRRAIVREIGRHQTFDRVIETGTYRGTSTEFFSAVFGSPILTIEGNPRYYEYSRRRLSVFPDISVELGDSRAILRRAGEGAAAEETVFIYLDAHWEEDLPLAEELDIIAATWPRAVVLIDDFKVPDDSGYTYDDYGPGKALIPEYLPQSVSSWHLLFPAARSSEETGSKRGSCVLVSPALSELVEKLSTLRGLDDGPAA